MIGISTSNIQFVNKIDIINSLLDRFETLTEDELTFLTELSESIDL
jgi:hypothetical protein